MNKSTIVPLPRFFDRYINLVAQENLMDALAASLKYLEELDLEYLNRLGDQVYAPNKWTLREIVQHLIDNERVQAYRILRIGRGDTSMREGFDENEFASHSFAHSKRLEDLVTESILVRKSTIQLIEGINPDLITNKATCSGIEISAVALGFQIVGHQIHHFNVLKERYYPLIDS